MTPHNLNPGNLSFYLDPSRFYNIPALLEETGPFKGPFLFAKVFLKNISPKASRNQRVFTIRQ